MLERPGHGHAYERWTGQRPHLRGVRRLAIAAVALCAWKARAELDERTVPLAGLVAAFIFRRADDQLPRSCPASADIFCGALAAILVGPHTGVLCIAIVLVVQSLLFADGGVTAPRDEHHQHGADRRGGRLRDRGRPLRAGAQTAPRPIGGRYGRRRLLSALAGTVSASTGFVVEYAIRRCRADVAGHGGGYMLGTHVLIGIGEGLITAVTVMAVVRSRPDPSICCAAAAPRRRCRMTGCCGGTGGSGPGSPAPSCSSPGGILFRQLQPGRAGLGHLCGAARSSRPRGVRS